MRRQFSRTLRANPAFARGLLGLLLLFSFLLGFCLHGYVSHVSLVTLRARDGFAARDAIAVSSDTPVVANAPRLTLLSTAFTGYSSARRAELSVARMRNSLLPPVVLSDFAVVCEGDAGIFCPQGSRPRPLSGPSTATYDALFRVANALATNRSHTDTQDVVVVIAHADLFFDESLFCARLVAAKTALALSRHPSPDCAAASGHGDTGWEASDLCAGYDVKRGASHDAFVIRPPIPETVLQDVKGLRTNAFGAENVVIAALKRAGWRVVNPCARVHAFHQHCSLERAKGARQSAGSVAERRGLFAGTELAGWVDGNEWMDSAFVSGLVDVDCLGLGRQEAVRTGTGKGVSTETAKKGARR